MKTKSALVAIIIAVAPACGKDDSREPASGQTPGNGQKQQQQQTPEAVDAAVAVDEELAGQTVTAQIDEGIAAAVEDTESEASSLALTQEGNGRVLRYRACVAEGDSAVVSVKHGLSRAWSFDGPKRAASTKMSAYRSLQRTWSRDGGEVACDENGKHAALTLRELEGVSLDVAFERRRARESSVTFKQRNQTVTRSHAASATGERHISWLSVVEADGSLTLTKTADATVQRKVDVKNAQGESVSLEASATSSAAGGGAPLKIIVQRDAATLAIQSRTIESGKLVATGKGGTRTETVFEGVKYVPNDGCRAVAGKISGAIYAKDATEPSVTYELVFGSEASAIVFSNGKTFEYTPEGCDLEEPETVVDTESAGEVETEAAG